MTATATPTATRPLNATTTADGRTERDVANDGELRAQAGTRPSGAAYCLSPSACPRGGVGQSGTGGDSAT
eukprot:9485575-Pyramimonas_sp.AAC.1